MRQHRQRLVVGGPGGRGFTLVELIVVIVIVGVLGAMTVPQLTGRAASARLRASANALKTAADYAHGYAMTRNVPTRLVIERQQGRFALAHQPEPVAEPGQWQAVPSAVHRGGSLRPGVSFSRVEVHDDVGATDQPETTQGEGVTFRPSGEAQAAVIEITDGTAYWSLAIAASTGRRQLAAGRATGRLEDRTDLDLGR